MKNYIYIYILSFYLYINKLFLYFFPIEKKYKLYNKILLYKINIIKRIGYNIYINGYCYYILDTKEKLDYNNLTLAFPPDTIESIYIKYNNIELIIEDFINNKILYDLLTHSSKNSNLKDLIYYYLKYILNIQKIDIEEIKIKFNNKFYNIDLSISIDNNYNIIETLINDTIV